MRTSVSRFRTALIVAVLLLTSPASAETLPGRVIRVADGDTLTVLVGAQNKIKVRLAGIDAPDRAQPFGERSRQNLARLVAGKTVEVRWHKRDRDGRVVGQVWVVSPDARCQGAGCPKTLDAGFAQLTVGLAWHFKKYAQEQSEEDRERYAFAEQEARARKAGLWRDREAVPPWEWRHR